MFDKLTDLAVSGAMGMFQRVAAAIVDDPTMSLPEFTQHTRLSPVTLIDRSVTMLPEDQLQNLLQTASAIFASHYLQAVSMGITINGVQTIDLIAPFSTSTDTNVGRLARKNLSDMLRPSGKPDQQSFKLPTYDLLPAMEDKAPDLGAHANLAVGRLLHVNVGGAEKSTTVPVTLTINPKVIDPASIPKLISTAARDVDFWSRYHQFRSGEIESVMDYLLALDLIEADRKAKLNDETGLYKQIQDRKRAGFFKRLMTGKPNLNNASAIHIVSKATLEEVEVGLKGKFSRYRNRQEYFEMTHAMMLIEVDARMERLHLYQRGIDDVGDYTFRDIQNNSKSASGLDMNALMQAYKLGESPNTL